LIETGKFVLAYDKPFLKEFVMHTKLPIALIQKALLEAKIFGAYPLESFSIDFEGLVAFAVTEKRTKAEIDELCRILGGLSW
jgi:glycine dehydrogenase subunit 1